MLVYALVIFAIAALGGLALASFVLRGEFAPWAARSDSTAHVATASWPTCWRMVGWPACACVTVLVPLETG